MKAIKPSVLSKQKNELEKLSRPDTSKNASQNWTSANARQNPQPITLLKLSSGSDSSCDPDPGEEFEDETGKYHISYPTKLIIANSDEAAAPYHINETKKKILMPSEKLYIRHTKTHAMMPTKPSSTPDHDDE